MRLHHGMEIRQMVAGLVGPVDATEQGAIFGFMDRQGRALQYARLFKEASEVVARDSKLDLEGLRPEAHPFLIGDAFAEACLETPGQLNSVQIALIGLSTKRKRSVEDLTKFESWVPESGAYDDIWTEFYSVMPEFMTGEEDAFDVFRVRMLAAAWGSSHRNIKDGYAWVVGAADVLPYINDPKQLVLANMMLESSMMHAWRVNAVASMALFNNSEFANVTPRGTIAG